MKQRSRRLQLEPGGEDRLGALRHRRPDEYARRQDAHHLADHRWMERCTRFYAFSMVCTGEKGTIFLTTPGNFALASMPSTIGTRTTCGPRAESARSV